MKTINEFLAELTDLDIQVWAEDDRLRINAPKGAITPALKNELAARKAELLNFLAAAHPVRQQSIQPVPRTQPLPLSLAQERIWFLEQLEAASAAYNLEMILRFTGTVRFDLLEQVIAIIVQRHESLRTTFPAIDGIPWQRIAPELQLSIPVIDLQPLPAPEQNAEVERLITQAAETPFDLDQGPLIRVTLLQLAPQSQVLLLAMHHIISDGWSIGIFIQELSVLYEALLHGQPAPLPELPIQYADFAVWQRQWLQGATLETKLNYWKQQLQDAPLLLALPTDRPRPAIQTFRGSTIEFWLNPELTQTLKSLSQHSKVTLFMTLLAAFTVLLYRYSHQTDICVGSPFANRTPDETKPLIGLFLNTLVFRIGLQENPTFTELLARVKQVSLEAYAHQDVPFEKLVETLPVERDLSHSLWFQVMFILLNIPPGGLNTSELSLDSRETRSAAAKFDLTLTMAEVQSGMQGMWEYNTDLFEATTIHRLTGHFQTLLEAVVANPEQQISELPLLTPAEQQQLLDWSQPATQMALPGLSAPACIHHWFEAQVERTPDAIAVQFEHQQLTYRELNTRANQLAHYCRNLGMEPESLVAICVERSLDMLVGLLAILKAGAAYVPLDPSYPSDRLAYILEDAQVSVLLTQQALLSRLPQLARTVICLDANEAIIADQSSANLPISVQPHHLAYVIYTSGSTGKPKGVMIEHQALLTFNQAAQIEYRMQAGDRVLQFASISFDAAVEEIYPCLTCGGTVVLRTEEMIRSAATFLHLCQAWQITVLDLPTAYWFQLLTEIEAANLALPTALRLVIIGGEPVLTEQVEVWKRVAGAAPALINTYGPTEATVVATIYDISSNTQALPGIPIGRPLQNAQVFVLDSHLQLLPVGVAGELCIGGAGLARGYRNQPELTAEKFIPHPFQAGRLYRTGDRVRYLSDGNLEFLGRLDQQVKIRGFRIELDEIVAILLQHPAVQQAVVEVDGDRADQRRLVAYLVLDPQQEFSLETIRQFLKAQLPAYMVPAAFVPLAALPLTANGKIDRRALPTPDSQSVSHLAGLFVAPRTQTEITLAEIWSEVLTLTQVSIQDNFFDLGGHSLLATQVISRIQAAFNLDLPLRALFESPTLEHLAAQIVLKQLEQANQAELEQFLAEVDTLSDEAVKQLLTEL